MGVRCDCQATTQVSASRAKRLLRCARDHRFHYVDKIRDDEDGFAAASGKAVHAVIEAAALARLDGEKLPIRADAAELIERLAEVAVAGGLSEDILTDASDVIRGVGSINLDPEMCITKPEFHWTMPIPGILDALAHGYYDYVRGHSGDVEVTDWKSGRMKVSRDDAPFDPQIGFYLVDARRRWPDAKRLRVTLAYLRDQTSVSVDWTIEIDRYHVALLQSTARRIISGYDEPRVGEACKLCDFVERCDAAKAWMAKKLDDPESVESMTTERLLDERFKASQLHTVAEKLRKKLDVEIKTRLKRGKVASDGHAARLVTRRNKSVSHDAIAAIAKKLDRDPLELVAEVTKLQHGKLLAAATTEEARAVLETFTTLRGSSFVSVKEKKL